MKLRWQMTKGSHMPFFMSMLICLRVSLNAHLQCCHKCPSAAQESKTGFDYCRKINWQCSKYVISSSERIDGRGWMDGWMDERMPRHACFLHLVTTISVLSRALACHTTPQHYALFFASTLPHGANRLLILPLFPIRAHAF